MSTAMTREEREAFLAETRLGMVAAEDPGRGPLMIPVWYAYEPGGVVRFATGAGSRKVGLLRASGRAGFCVQTDVPPYRYVSVEGPVAFSAVDFERDVRDMALRYLGPERARHFLEAFASEVDAAEQVLVSIAPERWNTVDYSKIGF